VDERQGLPKRHGEIIHHMVFVHLIPPPVNRIQGFVTDTGRFVDRKEGARIALAAGQVTRETMHDPRCLYSEDLY
jgi:hypothetical protein